MAVTQRGWLAVLVWMLLLASAWPAMGADVTALQGLTKLFETDPAAGFEKAVAVFEEPKQAGDLDGMMAILRVVQAPSTRCNYAAPRLVMAAAALPVAMARGDWAAVGEIRWTQAVLPGEGGWLRPRVLEQKATEAYAKAGHEPAAYTEWKASLPLGMRGCEESRAATAPRAAGVPEPIRLLTERFMEAVEQAEDAQASELMVAMAEAASTEPLQVRVNVCTFLCARMWLPGSERLVPTLRRWIVDAANDPPSQQADIIGEIVYGCGWAWSGRQDACLDAYNWCLQRVREASIPATLSGAFVLPMKMLCFGQPDRTDDTVRLLLELPPPLIDAASSRWNAAVSLIHPSMQPELRRRMVQEQLVYLDWALRAGQPGVLEGWTGFPGWQIAQTAPAADRADWCLETAYQIADFATVFPTPETRSRAATEAAAYFEKAERPDLAAQARDLAKALADGDPTIVLVSALTTARSQAAAGKWQEAVDSLAAPAAAAPDGAELLPAAILLGEASLRLGQSAEARRWMTRAAALARNLPLPAGEKANYLVTLAGLCDLAAQAVEGGLP